MRHELRRAVHEMTQEAGGGGLTMANEKRLIDANDVYSLFDVNGFARLHVVDIDAIPRVDAVEVLRCRDYAVPHNKYTGCPKLNGLVTTPDFFCSFGKRKDGDK